MLGADGERFGRLGFGRGGTAAPLVGDGEGAGLRNGVDTDV